MTDAGTAPALPADERQRDERYGVVGGHNTRCASLLGEGCDCRSPFEDTRDYGDDDRHRAYDEGFPEPDGADRW